MTEISPTSPPLLEVSGLNKRFGALVATRDLDLTVQPGEVHALIGPNGAGKTTLLAQLSGELAPDSGVIGFEGADITGLPVHRRARLGLVRSYQITALFEEMSAADNVALAVQAMAGHSFRFWHPARWDRTLRAPAQRALERLGLEPQADTPARHLAHGERRQLEVAMAVACRPRLLLLDEPMAGMGSGGSRRMTEFLAGLKGEITMLLVEHDMDAVFALADRVSVLVEGHVIASGAPDEVRRDRQVQAAYLGEGGAEVADA